MNELTYEDFYKVAQVTQHSEFEKYLNNILFKKDERCKFYDSLMAINSDLSVDSFKPYFELYAAERKSFQQDYTPKEVTSLMAELTRSDMLDHQTSKYSGYDATAGTGGIIIQKWHDDKVRETPWSYAPHRYLYRADELADNVMPYLLHNLAMRGMNAIVVHGDVLTGKSKQVYFIQNTKDDYMAYSDINVMPRNKQTEREFGVTQWVDEPIVHVESKEFIIAKALPMKRKKLEVNKNPKAKARQSLKNQLLLQDIAMVERAQKNKVYPKGTIVIQISATKGQIGLLKSNGEVDSRYATISTDNFIDSNFAFYFLKKEMPRHLHRVQEGLNIPIEEVGKCPFAFPIEILKLVLKEPIYEQLSLDLGI